SVVAHRHVSLDLELSEEYATVMANEVRRRNRDELRVGEDVMAREPDFDFGASGPHAPILYTGIRRKRRTSKSDEEEEPLVEEPIDPSKSWWQRTRENLDGDFTSIALLLFLYMLQGVPLGLIAAIPLVLQDRGVTLGQQAVFSFAYWPFSLKLLWAPIVDSLYWRAMGRRKSWMVPCQYLIGIFMLVLSYKVNAIIGDAQGDHGPDVVFLMMVFLPLNFLAATQDIAVDGWALTILSRKNVGYASTCNAVGQTAGVFLGNVVFLTLESKDFANKFRSVPQDTGFVDLAGFVFFWGCVFIVSTTLVWIFKKEVDNSVENKNSEDSDGGDYGELELGIVETYSVLWKILKLKPMIWMIVIYLTGKFAFAATDGITGFRLIGMGMPKDTLASFGLFLTPLQILLPWMIGKWTAGPRPLNIFLWAYPYRILVGLVFAALVYFTPGLKIPDTKDFYISFYLIWVAAYMFHQVATYCMFVSTMAFNAQISDPRIGGTYMTLLNTISNLGGNWPVTLILSITDLFTWKNCHLGGTNTTETVLYSCSTKAIAEQCTTEGNTCDLYIDGYYFGVGLCTIVGLIWYKLLFSKIKYIQKIPRKEWHVINK
ncbi:hypothetical protein PENTCL1PPCAC_7196, partial [Pristionchus entomophagus]